MREKYIEERHPRWFTMEIKGEGIDDANSFIGAAANRHEASAIINRHNELVDALVKLAQAFDTSDPEGFKRYWYDN